MWEHLPVLFVVALLAQLLSEMKHFESQIFQMNPLASLLTQLSESVLLYGHGQEAPKYTFILIIWTKIFNHYRRINKSYLNFFIESYFFFVFVEIFTIYITFQYGF